MSDPRMRAEPLKRYTGVHPVNTSLDTRSSRENSVVAENSSESGVVERKKMERMELACEERIQPGGGVNRWVRGLFYSQSPPHAPPNVGENVARRTEATRL